MDSSTPNGGRSGWFFPSPLLMIMGNLRQSAHGERTYAGNLGGSYEYIPEDREAALRWMFEHGSANDKATLFAIVPVEILVTPADEDALAAAIAAGAETVEFLDNLGDIVPEAPEYIATPGDQVNETLAEEAETETA